MMTWPMVYVAVMALAPVIIVLWLGRSKGVVQAVFLGCLGATIGLATKGGVEFSLDYLRSEPVMILALAVLVLLIILLALTRSWAALGAGVLGFLLGYVALGAQCGRSFAEDAARQGLCGDAYWGGGAAAGFLGALLGLVVWAVVRPVVCQRFPPADAGRKRRPPPGGWPAREADEGLGNTPASGR
ncbi:MAG: hypothetical protein HY812_04355 [Planctomycetes bacterium]|nr:hypothetical protein [Planctomycetota bacterium]